MNTKKRKSRITLFKTRASLYSKLKIEFLLDFSLRTCFHCVYFGQLFDSVLPWVEITLAHLNFKSNTIVLSPSHTLSTYKNIFLDYLFVPFSFQPLSFFLPVSARRKNIIIKKIHCFLCLRNKFTPLTCASTYKFVVFLEVSEANNSTGFRQNY